MRIYAIGDVHGRADLLSELFFRIDAHLQNHPLNRAVQVFLGDYVDRGPNSRGVLDLLIDRRRQHSTLCLKGNHETYVGQFLNDPSALANWKQIGGLSTIMSYGITPSLNPTSAESEKLAVAFRHAIPASHLKFLSGLPLTFTCGDFFFAHAGVRPGIPLKQQSERDLLLIREDFLLHEESFGKVVVHGHTPVMEPEIRPNRINIDTGAYATDRLTCLVLEGDELAFL
jgi:serine/threonine protein phosphatase 1